LVNTSSSAEGSVGAVTLTGNTTVGQSSEKLNFYSTLNGGGYTLTTVTNGTTSIFGDNQTDIRTANALTNLAGINVYDEFRIEASQNWTGTFTINNGALVDTYASGVTMSSSVNILAGGELAAVGSVTWSGGTFTLTGASTLDTTYGNMTINGTITGTGSFTKTGGDTLTLGGANTFNTPITVTGGVVGARPRPAPPAPPPIGESSLLNLNGGTFRYTGSAGATFSPTFNVGTSGGTLDNFGGSNIFYGGSVTGSGTLTILDSSGNSHQWLWTGNSPSFTGNITVGSASANSGWLQYRSNNSQPFGTASITVNAGGIFSADIGSTSPSTLGNNFILNGGTLGTQAANMTYSGTVSLMANSTLGHVSNGSGTVTLSGVVSGAAGPTITGNSTVILSNANTYAGNTTVNSGILQITNAGAIPASTSVTVNSGATFDTDGANLSGDSIPFSISGAGAANSFGALVNTGSGEGSVGAVTLSANTTVGQTAWKLNFYSTLNGGGYTLTTVTNGTGIDDQTDIRLANGLTNLAGINVNDDFRMESSQNWNGTFTVNSGATVDTYGSVTINSSVNLLAGGALSVAGGTGTWTGGTITLTGASTINTSGGSMTINGVIGGSGSFTVTGSNTLTLNGNNTFNTPITISGGVVATTVVAASGVPQPLGESSVLNLNGGTFRYTNTAAAAFSPTFNVEAGNGTIDNYGASDVFYGGSLSGAGTLTVLDSSGNSHQWLWTGNSPSFTGNIVVGSASPKSGWLQYRSNSSQPFGSGTITVNSGGIFSADVGSSSPASLGNNFVLNGGLLGAQSANMSYSGSLSVTANSTIGHVPNSSGNATIAVTGVISGSGGLTVNGGMTVTFSNANSYTGPTSIAGATTLALTGSGTTGGIASAATVSVAQGAFLNLAVPGIAAGQTLQITNSGTTPEVTLGAGINDTISYLVLNNGTSSFTLPPGTYGSSGGNDAAIVADGLTPSYFFTGTGTITATVPEPRCLELLSFVAAAGLLRRRGNQHRWRRVVGSFAGPGPRV
jgi:autotransporter-associated beta strand protein